MWTINLTNFFDTTATIWNKNQIGDGAGGFIDQPIEISTIVGTLQPISEMKILSASQAVIFANFAFYTQTDPIATVGDFLSIGSDEYNGTIFDIVGMEQPSINSLGTYYALFLKETLQ